MIPEFKDLRRKCRKQKIRVDKDTYFQDAGEFVELTKIFTCENIFDKILLWVDMIIYPLYVLYQLWKLNFSPMFIFSLMKTYELWIKWFRLRELVGKINTWKNIVKSLDGPWISTNNPDLHVFVYADGMERILHSLKLKKSIINPVKSINSNEKEKGS